jgi:SAM-dependent methyltransferase
MEQHAFDILRNTEQLWWYRGRAYVVAQALRYAGIGRVVSILDFGAGFGGMQKTLSRFGEHLFAMEPDDAARQAAAGRGYGAVFATDAEAFERSYDLIALFDVLEHLPDDYAFLQSARSALTDGGHVVITVPAMPFLWSHHDVTHHHYRRYTARTLREVLEAEGYHIEYLRYWNTLMFPAAVLMIKLGKGGEASLGMSRLLDRMLYSIIVIETILQRFLRIPAGVSLVVVAKKH